MNNYCDGCDRTATHPDFPSCAECLPGEAFQPGLLKSITGTVSTPENEDRPYLWRIWDILQLWRDDDHQWSSDEIEEVADVMLDWTYRARHILPPEQYRRNRETDYADTISADTRDELREVQPVDPEREPTMPLTDEGAEALRRELEEEAHFAERFDRDAMEPDVAEEN